MKSKLIEWLEDRGFNQESIRTLEILENGNEVEIRMNVTFLVDDTHETNCFLVKMEDFEPSEERGIPEPEKVFYLSKDEEWIETSKDELSTGIGWNEMQNEG